MRIAEYTEANEDVGAAIWIFEFQDGRYKLMQRFEVSDIWYGRMLADEHKAERNF